MASCGLISSQVETGLTGVWIYCVFHKQFAVWLVFHQKWVDSVQEHDLFYVYLNSFLKHSENKFVETFTVTLQGFWIKVIVWVPEEAQYFS